MKERILSALSQSEIEKEKKYLEGQKHGRQVICPIGQANQLIVFQIVGFHSETEFEGVRSRVQPILPLTNKRYVLPDTSEKG